MKTHGGCREGLGQEGRGWSPGMDDPQVALSALPAGPSTAEASWTLLVLCAPAPGMTPGDLLLVFLDPAPMSPAQRGPPHGYFSATTLASVLVICRSPDLLLYFFPKASSVRLGASQPVPCHTQPQPLAQGPHIVGPQLIFAEGLTIYRALSHLSLNSFIQASCSGSHL